MMCGMGLLLLLLLSAWHCCCCYLCLIFPSSCHYWRHVRIHSLVSHSTRSIDRAKKCIKTENHTNSHLAPPLNYQITTLKSMFRPLIDWYNFTIYIIWAAALSTAIWWFNTKFISIHIAVKRCGVWDAAVAAAATGTAAGRRLLLRSDSFRSVAYFASLLIVFRVGAFIGMRPWCHVMHHQTT